MSTANGKRQNNSSRTKKGPKGLQITRKRKRRTETEKDTQTRGLSFISRRLVQEIRPRDKASCLACLRLPVIIIKAVSSMAAAEQSSHLETPSEKEDKERQHQKQNDGYIRSNE